MLALVFAALIAVSPSFAAPKSKVFKSVTIHGTFSNYKDKKFYGEYKDWETVLEAFGGDGFKSKPGKVNADGTYEMVVPNLPAGKYHLHFGQPGKPHSTKTFDVDRDEVQVDMSWDV